MKKLFLFFVIISSVTFSQNYGTWKLTDSLDEYRLYAGSVELDNGNILIAGTNNLSVKDDSEIFDYKTGKWIKTNPMVVGKIGDILVKLNNGKVLALGDPCELYDPASNTWSLADSLETVDGSCTATQLDNGNALITGGQYYFNSGNSRVLSSCGIYNSSAGRWFITDSLIINRNSHTATKLLDGRVLVAGGSQGFQNAITSCEIYDPKTGKWTEAASLNIPRLAHSAILLPNGTVLVTGGMNLLNTLNPWLKSCELYNPDKNTWTIVDSLSVPRDLHTQILLKNGLLFIAGGVQNSATWELYDPSNFTRVHLDNYPDKQIDYFTNSLSNGKILCFGGFTWEYGGSIQFPAMMCYLYDPSGIDGVKDENKNTVKDFKLSTNYPNPFNPSTTISYQLPKASKVMLKVYNILGEEIITLVNGYMTAGSHSATFNAGKLASGVYLYKLDAEAYSQSRKMILAK
jgi:N-acetylneuraminic acid mutarotase